MAKRKKKRRVALSDQIRQAVAGCGELPIHIARETSIDKSTLSRFLSEERGLPMKTLDRLADYLGLNITTEGSTPTKGQKRGQYRT